MNDRLKISSKVLAGLVQNPRYDHYVLSTLMRQVTKIVDALMVECPQEKVKTVEEALAHDAGEDRKQEVPRQPSGAAYEIVTENRSEHLYIVAWAEDHGYPFFGGVNPPTEYPSRINLASKSGIFMPTPNRMDFDQFMEVKNLLTIFDPVDDTASDVYKNTCYKGADVIGTIKPKSNNPDDTYAMYAVEVHNSKQYDWIIQWKKDNGFGIDHVGIPLVWPVCVSVCSPACVKGYQPGDKSGSIKRISYDDFIRIKGRFELGVTNDSKK